MAFGFKDDGITATLVDEVTKDRNINENEETD
jgi:hypothetical protein